MSETVALKTAMPTCAVLRVDLDAVAANYRALRTLAKPGETAPVVKADSYGLGVERVSARLWEEGARTFFVATLTEGVALRSILAKADIYVLNGFLPGQAGEAAATRLRPILNSFAEYREWQSLGDKPAAGLQIDTGMNRTGMSAADLDQLFVHDPSFSAIEVGLVMSHLACADEVTHAKNSDQLRRFREAAARFPKRPLSLAASGGIFGGQAFCLDIVRPGIALYGGNPRSDAPNPMRSVVTLEAPIVQTRSIDKPETVGYGATYGVGGLTRLATVALGYADGLMRSLSNCGVAAIGGTRVPIVGRVSMDLVTIDISKVPKAERGTMVEFVGPTISIDEAAHLAGTLPYEFLTRLGSRIERTYLEKGGPTR
jgi:alanine racemase